MQIIIQNHCTLKVTESKTRYKAILGSNIYAKLLFPHAIKACDTTSLINGEDKSTVFKKTCKSHEEIESAGKKSNVYLFSKA